MRGALDQNLFDEQTFAQVTFRCATRSRIEDLAQIAMSQSNKTHQCFKSSPCSAPY